MENHNIPDAGIIILILIIIGLGAVLCICMEIFNCIARRSDKKRNKEGNSGY